MVQPTRDGRPYIIRNYQPGDFRQYIHLSIEAEEREPLNIEAEEREPSGHAVSAKLVAQWLRRPGYSPGEDLFLVETGGEIVAYLDMEPEVPIGRIILRCWVHPVHRRRGLATRLLGGALRRARELGAGVVQVKIFEDNVVARTALSRLGFQCIRQQLELRLDMARFERRETNRSGVECRHLQCGEEDKLTEVQNRCFAGQWGYKPNTVEEIAYKTNLGNRSLQDILIASDGGRVIGYCWTEIINGERTAVGRRGRIFMLGTDPDYRGRGIGRELLLRGLTYLKSNGVGTVDLSVDSENTIAHALYREIGFEVRTSSLWYERPVS